MAESLSVEVEQTLGPVPQIELCDERGRVHRLSTIRASIQNRPNGSRKRLRVSRGQDTPRRVRERDMTRYVGYHRGRPGAQCLEDGIWHSLRTTGGHEYVGGGVNHADVVAGLDDLSLFTQIQIGDPRTRRFAATDAQTENVHPGLRKAVHNREKQITALALPIPPKMHEHLAPWLDPELFTRSLALIMSCGRQEALEIDGIWEHNHAPGRRQASPNHIGGFL